MWNIFVREISGRFSPQNLDPNRLSQLVPAIDNNYKRHWDVSSGGGTLKQRKVFSSAFKRYLNIIAAVNRGSWPIPFSVDFSIQLSLFAIPYWMGRIIDGPLATVVTIFPGIWIPIPYRPNFIYNANHFACLTAITLYIQKMTVLGIRFDKTTGLPLPWYGGMFVTFDTPPGVGAVTGPMIQAFDNTVEQMYNLYWIQDRAYANALKALFKDIVLTAFPAELFETLGKIGPGFGTGTFPGAVNFSGADGSLLGGGGAFGGSNLSSQLQNIADKIADIYANSSVIGGTGNVEDYSSGTGGGSGGGGGTGGGSGAGGGGGGGGGNPATSLPKYGDKLVSCSIDSIPELSGSLTQSRVTYYPGLNYNYYYQETDHFLITRSLDIWTGESTSSLKEHYLDLPNNTPYMKSFERVDLERNRRRENIEHSRPEYDNGILNSFSVKYTVKSRLLKIKTKNIELDRGWKDMVISDVDVVADKLLHETIVKHKVDDLNKSAFLFLKEDFKFKDKFYRLAPYTARALAPYRSRFNVPEERLNIYQPDYSVFTHNVLGNFASFRLRPRRRPTFYNERKRKEYYDKNPEYPWINYIPYNSCSVALIEVLVRPVDYELYIDYVFIDDDNYYENYKNKAEFPGGVPFEGLLGITHDSLSKTSIIQGNADKYTLLPYRKGVANKLNRRGEIDYRDRRDQASEPVNVFPLENHLTYEIRKASSSIAERRKPFARDETELVTRYFRYTDIDILPERENL